MRKVDLHNHSNFSDGYDSLDDMVKIAIEQGIEEFAITDHLDVFGHFLFSRIKPAEIIGKIFERNYSIKTKIQ